MRCRRGRLEPVPPASVPTFGGARRCGRGVGNAVWLLVVRCRSGTAGHRCSLPWPRLRHAPDRCQRDRGHRQVLVAADRRGPNAKRHAVLRQASDQHAGAAVFSGWHPARLGERSVSAHKCLRVQSDDRWKWSGWLQSLQIAKLKTNRVRAIGRPTAANTSIKGFLRTRSSIPAPPVCRPRSRTRLRACLRLAGTRAGCDPGSGPTRDMSTYRSSP